MPPVRGESESSGRDSRHSSAEAEPPPVVGAGEPSMPRCDGRHPVPGPRTEPFEVTYRCGLNQGHEGEHGPVGAGEPCPHKAWLNFSGGRRRCFHCKEWLSDALPSSPSKGEPPAESAEARALAELIGPAFAPFRGEACMAAAVKVIEHWLEAHNAVVRAQRDREWRHHFGGYIDELMNDAAARIPMGPAPEPEEVVKAGLRAVRAQAFEEAAERHEACAQVALAKGMGARSLAYCEGWVQAHRESESHFLGRAARAREGR
jgi:hypothetical protein